MGDVGVQDHMSIAEQALFLLDIFPSAQNRRQPDSFLSLDRIILNSLGVETAQPLAQATPNLEPVNQSPFSVASRLSRSNYEDQARAEALMNALKKLRNRTNASAAKSSRVIRDS